MNSVAQIIDSPLSLYIHLPWCLHKCAYCDFNSHAISANQLPEQQYIEQLVSDLTISAQLIQQREVKSIFIGGGTPSLFSAESIDKILSACRQLTCLQTNSEITLEANPSTFEYQKFLEFLSTGVNRISIGAQSFNNKCLERLERIHDQQEAITAIQTAHKIGFKNINVDLMFSLPEQSVNDAKQDINIACGLPVTHISYYQLTLEPNTMFYRFPPKLPDEDTAWSIQNNGQKMLNQHGFERYEVSAYAHTGMQCVHNCNYWQYGDYLGIGAGAHSKLTTQEGVMRQQRTRQPNSYINAVASRTHVHSEHIVDIDSLIFEFMLNNLRLISGFSIESFTYSTGLPWLLVETKINYLVAQGLLEEIYSAVRSTSYKPTSHGYQYLDEITQHFLPTT